MDPNKLLALPEYIQVVIVSGFIGYSIAYAGFRDKEQKDDKLYRILAFGLFGYFFYDFTRQYCESIILPGLGAILVSMLVAIFWRKRGKKTFTNLLYKDGISNEDGINDTWTRITQDSGMFPTQVVICLKDGSKVECDDVQAFKDAPVPIYYTDNSGNFALYVTKETAANGTQKEFPTVRNSNWGDRLTYLPKSEISQIKIRFKEKPKKRD